LQNFFATSGFPVTIVLGATFMICVLLFRRGVVGEVRHWLDNRKA
jgi:branched-chain amino acid transport system permease protein